MVNIAVFSTTVWKQVSFADNAISETNAKIEKFGLELAQLEASRYNGILIWKITNYKQQFEEALSGHKRYTDSPLIYTSRHGYKMLARLYLNGDGIGTGSHMSLSFEVLKEEFDALLPWPFRQTVTLKVLNQLPSKRNISIILYPEPTSPSFKRPTSVKNIPYHFPQFVPLKTLQSPEAGYVNDNTLYIRIDVDRNGLPNF